jgi:hypothetical protein
MDESKAQQAIQEHADAVVAGDFDRVVADFTEGLRPQVPELAKVLPQPVESAQVLSVQPEGDDAIAQIQYSGAGKDVTIQTRWTEEADGTVRIQHGEPV